MASGHDLKLVLQSETPIVVIETLDEPQLLHLLVNETIATGASAYQPLFRWSITDGLQRLDIDLEVPADAAEPESVLRHIRKSRQPGVYVLLDFHPYLREPVNVRLLKDIAIDTDRGRRSVVLLSHKIDIPPELEHLCLSFDMTLPDAHERRRIVEDVAREWVSENPGSSVQADQRAFDLLISNLAGLTHSDTRRLARNAIFQDGAITRSDLAPVMEAKYRLLNRDGILSYEYDTAQFAQVGGQGRLRTWLSRRRSAFRDSDSRLDPPRGMLLLGVQGCGKSLAAKAVAGVFDVPLLKLDFGRVYNKYHGESERNLRTALATADVMSPCVLWVDEIEKSIASGQEDSGTSNRILGTFLTWMAERKNQVFVVATANDVSAMPPELMRKGRFDETFFVDLPGQATREELFRVHFERRDVDVAPFNVEQLAHMTDGFSGAEIEQAIVSAMYTAHAQDVPLDGGHVINEIRGTYPLSVTMREKISQLRHWAADRAVAVE
ncbi:MAG: AAA family ATPase [Pseudomonadota bacterium]